MTEKNNGLTSAQEVLYDEEFQRADGAGKNDNKQQNANNKKIKKLSLQLAEFFYMIKQ